MGKIKRKVRIRAKKWKAEGPDVVPMELPQKCLPAFDEMLFENSAAGAKLGCVMKDWYFSIFIPIFKKTRLIAVPANHRILRLSLIFRIIFETGTTERIVNERPEELQSTTLTKIPWRRRRSRRFYPRPLCSTWYRISLIS